MTRHGNQRVRRRMITVGLLSAWGIWLAASGQGACQESTRAIDDRPRDSRIREQVGHALMATWALPADSIKVSVNDGIVTLAGSVPHLLAKDQATRAAEAVLGVRAVVNRVVVKPPARSDAFLVKHVQQALAADPVAEAGDIRVEVRRGVVTLSGQVGSIVERRAAAQAVKWVIGVRSVQNRLDFIYEEERSDECIAGEIGRRLRYDALVLADRIEVEVEDGHVRLSGEVPCARERRRAHLDALLPGVRSVDVADLEVNPEMDRAYAHRTGFVESGGSPGTGDNGLADEAIERAVVETLFQDPRIGVDLIEVEVDDGVVFLEGQVQRPSEVRLAEEDARHTVGVVAVMNYLSVRPAKRPTDQRIRGDALETLERNVHVNADSIQVAVRGGLIYLFGTVTDHGTVRHATEALEEIPGAVAVLNNVRVLHRSPEGSDEDLRKRVQWLIEGAPLVNAEEVVVLPNAGNVVLRGDVRTWTGRAVAEELAYQAGAFQVINHLDVRAAD